MANNKVEITAEADIGFKVSKVDVKSVSESIDKALKGLVDTAGKPLSISIPTIDLKLGKGAKGYESQVKKLKQFSAQVDSVVNHLQNLGGKGNDRTATRIQAIGSAYEFLGESLATVQSHIPSASKFKVFEEALSKGDGFFNQKKFNSPARKATAKKALAEVSAYYEDLNKLVTSANKNLSAGFSKAGVAAGGSVDGEIAPAVFSKFTEMSNRLKSDIAKAKKVATSDERLRAKEISRAQAEAKRIEQGAKKLEESAKRAEKAAQAARRVQDKIDAIHTKDGKKVGIGDLSSEDRVRVGGLQKLRDRYNSVNLSALERASGGDGRKTRAVENRKLAQAEIIAQEKIELANAKLAIAEQEKLNRAKKKQLELENSLASRANKASINRGGRVFNSAGSVSSVHRSDLPDVSTYLQDRVNRLQGVRQRLLVRDSKGPNYESNLRKVDEAIKVHTDALEKAGIKQKTFNTLTGQAASTLKLFLRYAVGYGVLYKMLGGVTALTSGLIDLDKSLHSIKAITQATTKEMVDIKSAIKSVAVSTQFDLGEIASAAQVLAQAGTVPQEMQSALSSVATFSSATNTALQTSADLISTMRNVFTDLSDGRIADMLTKAVNISKLTGDDLKVILSRGLQTAKAYKLTSEQYLSAVTVLSNAGIKASTVSTGLRQAILETLSPSPKAIKALQKRYAAIGESLSKSAIKGRFFSFQSNANPLLSALTELKKLGFGGSGKLGLERVFNVRASNVLGVLVNNLDQLNTSMARFGVQGSATAGAATQMNSLEASMKNLGATVVSLADTLSGSFVTSLTSATQTMTDFLKKYEEVQLVKNSSESKSGNADTPASIAAGIAAFRGVKGGVVKRAVTGLVVAGSTSLGLNATRASGHDSLASGASVAVTALSLFNMSKWWGGLSSKLAPWISKVKTIFTAGRLGEVTGAVSKLAKFAKLPVSPVGWLLTLSTVAYELYSFLATNSLSSRLEAVGVRLSKTKEAVAKAKAKVDALDPSNSDSISNKVSTLSNKLVEFNDKVAKILGISKDKVALISGELNSLGSNSLDLGGSGASRASASISAKTGVRVSSKQLSELATLSEGARSASLQIKAFKSELLKFVSDSKAVSNLKGSDKALAEAVQAGIKDGFAGSNSALVDAEFISGMYQKGFEAGSKNLAQARTKQRSLQATEAGLSVDQAIKGGNAASAIARLTLLADGSARVDKELKDTLTSIDSKLAVTDAIQQNVHTRGRSGVAMVNIRARAVARAETLNTLREGVVNALDINQTKLGELKKSKVQEYIQALDTVKDLIKKGGEVALVVQSSLPKGKGILNTSAKFQSGTTNLTPESSKNLSRLKSAASKGNAEISSASDKLRKSTYRTPLGDRLREVSLKESKSIATANKNYEEAASLSQTLSALSIKHLKGQLSLARRQLAGPLASLSDDNPARRAAINSANNAEVAIATEKSRVAKEALAFKKKVRIRDINLELGILNAKKKELNFALSKVDPTSDKASEIRKSILEADREIRGSKIQLVAINKGDVDTAVRIKHAEDAIAKHSNAIAGYRAQIAENDRKIAEANRLTPEQSGRVASGQSLSVGEKAGRNSKVLSAMKGKLSNLKDQRASGTLNPEEIKAIDTEIANLNLDIANLTATNHDLTKSFSEAVNEGFNFTNIANKIQEVGVTSATLGNTIRDTLVSAYLDLGTAIANAVVKGDSLLGTLKSILFQASQQVLVSEVKTGINGLLDGITGRSSNKNKPGSNKNKTGSDKTNAEQSVASGLSSIFDNVLSTGSSVFSSISSGLTSLFGGVFDGGSSIASTIGSGLSSIFSSVFSSGGGGGGGGGFLSSAISIGASLFGFSTGGIIKGTGSPTADDKLIKVSSGEAILNAKAVQALGANFINSVNASGSAPVNVYKGSAGSVSNTPANASNSSQSTGPLNLDSIGGKQYTVNVHINDPIDKDSFRQSKDQLGYELANNIKNWENGL